MGAILDFGGHIGMKAIFKIWFHSFGWWSVLGKVRRRVQHPSLRNCVKRQLSSETVAILKQWPFWNFQNVKAVALVMLYHCVKIDRDQMINLGEIVWNDNHEKRQPFWNGSHFENSKIRCTISGADLSLCLVSLRSDCPSSRFRPDKFRAKKEIKGKK